MFNLEELPKVLLKCISREDAEKFINSGIIKFGTAEKWINYCCTKGNNRIGDDLEGVYSRHSILEKSAKLNSYMIKSNIDKGFFNYWRGDILNLPVCCFYGIGKRNIKKIGAKTLYHTQDIGYVDISYFKDFFNNSNFSEEEYKKIPKDQQKVIIFIYEPVKLVNLIVKELGNIVLYDNVEYIDKKQTFDIESPYPYELFYKDNVYKEQSEFRIILTDTSIKEIRIGNLSSFCRIEEMYFGKLDFAFQENNTFLYKLPKEIEHSWVDEDFEKLVTTFLVLVELDFPIQRKTILDYQGLIDNVKPYLMKYGITPYIRTNLITNSFNIKYDFEDENYKSQFYKVYNDLHHYNDKHFHTIVTIDESE